MIMALFSNETFGQVSSLKEINIGSGIWDPNVFNLYEDGLAIESEDKDQLTFYDQNLKKTGIVKYSIGNQSGNTASVSYYDSLLKYFVIVSGKDIAKSHRKIALISPKTNKIKYIELNYPNGKAYMKLRSRFFKVDKSVFINTVTNNTSTLSTVDLTTGRVSPVALPDIWEKRNITGLHRVNSKYLAVYYEEIKDDKPQSNIALIDDYGTHRVDKLLKPEDVNIPAMSVSFSEIDSIQFTMSGNYYSSQENGFFLAKYKGIEEIFFNYYDLRIKDDFSECLPKGISKSSDYSSAVNPVIAMSEGNVLVAADCYRHHPMTYWQNDREYSRTVYDLTHTVVLNIDSNGELITEWCFSVKRDSNYRYVTPYITQTRLNNKIVYSYVWDNEYYYSVFSGQDLSEIEIIKLPDNVMTELSMTGSITFKPWYGSYYYSVLNKDTGNKKGILRYKVYNFDLVKYNIDPTN